MDEEWYKLSTPEFDKVAYDPLDPPKRYHTGIFIETDSELFEGTMFHVTGDIIAASGMRFEVRENYAPAESKYFYRDTTIGWIRKADFPRIEVSWKPCPDRPNSRDLTFGARNQVSGIRLLRRSRMGISTAQTNHDGQS